MKQLKHTTLAALGLGFIVSLGSCSDQMDEIKDLVLDRNFAPVALTAKVVNKTNVKLEWNKSEADSYTVEVFANDSLTFAKELVRLLQGLDCRINRIRFHQIPDVDLQAADEHRMEQFRDYLCQHGITTTIRASRGQDIYAACGLLTTDKKKALAEGRKAGNGKS